MTHTAPRSLRQISRAAVAGPRGPGRSVSWPCLPPGGCWAPRPSPQGRRPLPAQAQPRPGVPDGALGVLLGNC